MKAQVTGTLLLAAVCFGAPKPAVKYKVADAFIPAPYEAQHIEGVLGERMRVNLEQRLLRVDEPALLAGFRKRPGNHPWIGEHVGKFLHAGVNTWRYTRDERLKSMMDRMVRDLVAAQRPDGYLGTYTDDQRWTSWDVWVHKYNLIGLLSYYEATEYEPALAAARKMGDLLAATFGDQPGKRDLIAASTHVGMAASSVLEPVVQLYRWTGDKRYLEFARYIVRSWDQPNGPKIIRSLLEHGDVSRTANGKAYEMMSCLVGLLELYRITGEAHLLKVAQTAWEDIATKRLYITGTTSSHEHFQPDHVLPGAPADDVGEGCATVTWLQLNWHLLRLSGERKYANELERTVYNQLLAAQDPANGNICYFTPLIGYKHATPGINCCVSSEPRGISMIPQLAWGATRDDMVTIMMYVPGTLTLGNRKVEVRTEFPASGKVEVAASGGGKKFCIDLRVPEWTSRFALTYRGNGMKGDPGQHLQVCDRFQADTPISIDMDMTVREIPGGKSYPGMVAIQRGPQVLALDADANPALTYLHRAAVASVQLGGAAPKYTVPGIVQRQDGGHVEQPLTLIPFSETRWYRVWLAKPDTLPSSLPPLTTYARESASRTGKNGSITDERTDTFRSTDRGSAPEEDWFAVEMRRPEQIRRVVFQHGPEGRFAATPRVEVKRTASGAWEKIGDLAGYSASGSSFELKLDRPVEAMAVRVVGKPDRYVTCAELTAY